MSISKYFYQGTSSCNESTESYLYGCLLQMGQMTPLGTVFVSLFQMCFASYVVAYGVSVVGRQFKSVLVGSLWGLVMILVPIYSLATIYLERDTVYAWLFLFIVLASYDYFFGHFKKWTEAFWLIFLSTILFFLRREGFISLAFLVFFLPVRFGKYFLGLLMTLFTAGILTIVFHITIPKMMGIEFNSNLLHTYNVTAYWAVLSEIRLHPKVRISKEESDFFEKVCPLEKLRTLDPVDYSHIELPQEGSLALHLQSAKLILKNLDIFKSNRWRVIEETVLEIDMYDFIRDSVSTEHALMSWVSPFLDKVAKGRSVYDPRKNTEFQVKLMQKVTFWGLITSLLWYGIVFNTLLIFISLKNHKIFFTFSMTAVTAVTVALTLGESSAKHFFFLILCGPFMLFTLAQQLRERAVNFENKFL